MASHEPVIRPRREHCISRRDIDPDALKVLYRLARGGHVAYLVGGGVRDLLLHRMPKDFDVSTSAHPRQIKELFRNCFLIGRRFRLAHIRYGEKVIETSTFRSPPPPPDEEDDLLQRDDNSFGTPEEDACRRDFTINGLFYCIETFSVIDYVGGLKDLEAELVRCIGDPEIRFREDPVRMVRAVRFASRLGFRIEDSAWQAIRTHHADIQKASPARLTEEIYKLYAYGAAEAAFRLLWRTLLLQDLFPMLHTYLENAGGDAAPLWRYLAALDQGDTVMQESTQPLMLATLAYHPLLLHHEAKQSRDSQTAWIESVQHVTERLFLTLKIPRWVRDRVRQILSTQYRFLDGKRQRFSKTRLAAQDYFPEALALYEIHLSARGADFLHEAAPWQTLFEERMNAMEDKSPAPIEDPVDGEEDWIAASVEEPRRRRSSRRRRRKKRSGSDTNGTDVHASAQEAPASPKDSAAGREAAAPATPATGNPSTPEDAGGEAQPDAPRKKKRRRGGRKHRRRTESVPASEEQDRNASGTEDHPSVPTPPAAIPQPDPAIHPAPEAPASPEGGRAKKKRRSRKNGKGKQAETSPEPGSPPAPDSGKGSPRASTNASAQRPSNAQASDDVSASNEAKASDGTPPADAREERSATRGSGEKSRRRPSKKRSGAHGANVLRDDRPMQDLTAFDAETAAPHWMDEL